MANLRRHGARFRLDLSLLLFAALLVILWLAGGASREDAAGQIVSRAASWLAIIIVILFAKRPQLGEARGVALILLSAILLCVAQLIPLPPVLWHALPGRETFADPLISPPGDWRPWSLVPGATLNALYSLVVPFAILLLVSGLQDEQKNWTPTIVLAVISLSLLVGLLQFTGAGIVNPFVNGTPGAVDGMIANRNHFALVLAIGLLIAPSWGVSAGRFSRVRAPAAFGLVLLLVLTILASGSRSGIALGATALLLGFVISRRSITSALRRYPRWMRTTLAVGLITLIIVLILISVLANRAESINRLLDQNSGEDLRARALPTVLDIIRTYFPFGTGFGSFDPIFRVHEPFSMVQGVYFNHAHNDYLEIVLTSGLPGLIILLIAIGWWLRLSATAWRQDFPLPKLGSGALFLIMLASLVDYPARTPVIMAMTMLGALWLAGQGSESNAPLPSTGRKL
jgi:O-antigen ligase